MRVRVASPSAVRAAPVAGRLDANRLLVRDPMAPVPRASFSASFDEVGLAGGAVPHIFVFHAHGGNPAALGAALVDFYRTRVQLRAGKVRRLTGWIRNVSGLSGSQWRLRVGDAFHLQVPQATHLVPASGCLSLNFVPAVSGEVEVALQFQASAYPAIPGVGYFPRSVWVIE